MSGQPSTVRCHSGYTYAQRPVSFTHAGEEYRVERILMENRTPNGKLFLVETGSGQRFELIFFESTADWQILILQDSSSPGLNK